MATTVQFDGAYEIFPLCATTEDESIEFDEILTHMGDGYYQQVLIGTNLGTRSWNLSFKNLKGGTADLDIIYLGTPMSVAAYLWDLFKRTKVSGTPFRVTSPVTGTNHLAMFADSKLTYQKMYTKLFSAGINLVQVRLPGVSGYG